MLTLTLAWFTLFTIALTPPLLVHATTQNQNQVQNHVQNKNQYRPIKDIFNTQASIKIYGPKNWLPENIDFTKLQLFFSPPLIQNEDFIIWDEPSKHVFPEHMVQLRKGPLALHVLLNQGKLWVKNMEINTTQDLRLINVRYGNKDLHGYKSSIKGHEDVVARVFNYPETTPVCPKELILPGASAKLQQHVNDVLHYCQAPLILNYQYHFLKRRQFHTIDLLTLQPNVIFFNATGQDLQHVSKAVDRFLGAHSVLDVVWEPFNPGDPPFWILMPRPLGMPGHLFGMLDALQWRSDSIVRDKSFIPGPLGKCSNPKTCIGCAQTKLAGITGSGYSADAFNVFSVLRDGFMRNHPVQAYPSTLGIRSTPPSTYLLFFHTFCLLMSLCLMILLIDTYSLGGGTGMDLRIRCLQVQFS
jgi:hypothetical protein